MGPCTKERSAGGKSKSEGRRKVGFKEQWRAGRLGKTRWETGKQIEKHRETSGKLVLAQKELAGTGGFGVSSLPREFFFGTFLRPV